MRLIIVTCSRNEAGPRTRTHGKPTKRAAFSREPARLRADLTISDSSGPQKQFQTRKCFIVPALKSPRVDTLTILRPRIHGLRHLPQASRGATERTITVARATTIIRNRKIW